MPRATAATKRSSAALQGGAAQGRAAKSAKVVAAAAAEAREPEPEWCRPAFTLLDFLEGSLPAACSEMLRAAAPHALGAKADERHAYQTAVVDSLTRLSAEALRSHGFVVESLEAAASSLAQERERAAKQMAVAASDEEAKRGAKGAAAAKNTRAEEAVAARKQAREGASKKLEELEALTQAVSEAKEELEKELGEIWAPLKAGTFPPKDWRARQKAIARASELLAQVAVPASLAAALPLALKERPESRTDFAAQVIEHAEAALREHIASINAEIENHQAGVASQTQVVLAAEGEVEVAEGELDAAMQAWIEAENAWVEADSAVRDLTATIRGFGQKAEELDSELVTSKASLEKLRSLIGPFEGLRDNVEVQPMDAAVATEPLADVSAEVPADFAGERPADMAAAPAVDAPSEVPAGSAEVEGRHVASAECSAA